MKKINTRSGAIYFLRNDGRTITGGSKNLKNGHLLIEPRIGRCMLISTPERYHLHPHILNPGVTTSDIVSIEDYVPTAWERIQAWLKTRISK